MMIPYPWTCARLCVEFLGPTIPRFQVVTLSLGCRSPNAATASFSVQSHGNEAQQFYIGRYTFFIIRPTCDDSDGFLTNSLKTTSLQLSGRPPLIIGTFRSYRNSTSSPKNPFKNEGPNGVKWSQLCIICEKSILTSKLNVCQNGLARANLYVSGCCGITR